MVISKRFLLTVYFYIAILALTLSTCLVMLNNESDNENRFVSVAIAMAFCIFAAFIVRTFKRGYTIEIPSITILLFNVYFIWIILITALVPEKDSSFNKCVVNILWVSLPFFVTNTVYYFVLHRGNNNKLQLLFLFMVFAFLITYWSFYDMDNILMNIHLGSSYYSLYMLPLVISYPSRIVKIIGLICVSIAVFSSVKRGGVAALLAGVFVYIIIRQSISDSSKFSKLMLGIIFITLLSSIFIYIGTLGDNNIFERFESIETDNGSGRTNVWAETWRLINEQDILSFFIGNGYNAVLGASRLVLSAHNDYLEAWYDYGLIGFVLYSISIISVLIMNIKAIKAKHPVASALSMMSAIVVILTLISHIAIYFWMNIVMLNIAYFAGRIDYDKKR